MRFAHRSGFAESSSSRAASHYTSREFLSSITLLLARHRNAEHGGDEEKIERYLIELAEWAERERAEAKFEPTMLWTFLIEHGYAGRRASPAAIR